MDSFKFPALGLALLLLTVPQGFAANFVIDSFTEGSVELADNKQPSDLRQISGAYFDRRLLGGSRTGAWTASLSASAGTFNFTSAFRKLEPGDDFPFDLVYFRSGGDGAFSVLGSDGFSIQIRNVTGLGELSIYSEEDPDDSVRMPITASGSLFYPMTNFMPGMPRDNLTMLAFSIFPRSTDFSITLDEISLVPEPDLAGLLLAAGCALIMARRRRTGVST